MIDDEDDLHWSFEERDDSLVPEEPEETVPYDPEERTARVGEIMIDFARAIPVNPVTSRLIVQLVGCGTSVGAIYREADDTISTNDFLHKVGICRKEAHETQYYLRMIVRARPEVGKERRALWKDARELNRIFSAIWRKGKIRPE